jgi:hypothetical protein
LHDFDLFNIVGGGLQHHSIHPGVCVRGATNQNHVSVARVPWVATGTHNSCGDHDVHFCRLLRHFSSIL